MTVLNLNELGNSPTKELSDRGDIDKYKPRAGEVSLQTYDGTNVCQWHYRNRVYWHPTGPKFLIIENNKKLNHKQATEEEIIKAGVNFMMDTSFSGE